MEVPSFVPSPTVSYEYSFPAPPDAASSPSLYHTGSLNSSSSVSETRLGSGPNFTLVDSNEGSNVYIRDQIIRIESERDGVIQISCEEENSGETAHSAEPEMFVGHAIRLFHHVLFIPTVDLTGKSEPEILFCMIAHSDPHSSHFFHFLSHPHPSHPQSTPSTSLPSPLRRTICSEGRFPSRTTVSGSPSSVTGSIPPLFGSTRRECTGKHHLRLLPSGLSSSVAALDR